MTKPIFILMVLAISSLMAKADPETGKGTLANDSSYWKGRLPPPPVKEDRPVSIPSSPLEYVYGPGFLELALPRGVQYAKVRLFNSTQDWSGIVTVEQPRVEIPLFSGECRIICWTDDERQYSGKLFFPEIQ